MPRLQSLRAYRVHIIIGCALAVVLCALIFFFQPTTWHSERVLRIGYQDTPPLNYRDTDGRPIGTAVEVIQQAAKRAGVRLDWVYHPRGSESGLLSKSVDLWPIIPRGPGHLGLLNV